MSDDLFAGCGTLACLIIIGVALFFAMYFGNAFSIPGAIVLLIIGLMVIIKLAQMLMESQQEAIEHRTARRTVENENQGLKTWLEEQQ